MNSTLTDPDGFLDLLRLGPALAELRGDPLDRKELERRLDVSRATSHRITKALTEQGLIERTDGKFGLTSTGLAVTEATDRFKTEVTTALRLAPVLDALDDTCPPLPPSAFADATATSGDRGDPHSPAVRFASLVEETSALRGFDTWSIAPTYMGAIQRRILDGMETELVDPVDVVGDVMERYPERCVEVCVSGNLTIRIHANLPFGLALFDDRVGIAVRDPDTNALRTFVDTDSAEVREWAEAVYEVYRRESVVLETFTKKGLREALAGV